MPEEKIKATITPREAFQYSIAPTPQLPQGLQLEFTLNKNMAHLEGFALLLEQALADVRSAAFNIKK